jgi:hypothetical protein
MALHVVCDWCGEDIVGYWTSLKPDGFHPSGKRVSEDRFYYHGTAPDEELMLSARR